MLNTGEKFKKEEIFDDKESHLKECYQHSMNINSESEIGMIQRYKENCFFFIQDKKLVGIDKNFVKYFEYSLSTRPSLFFTKEITISEDHSRIYIFLYKNCGETEIVDTSNSTCISKLKWKKGIRDLFSIEGTPLIIACTKKGKIVLYKTEVTEESDHLLRVKSKKIVLKTPIVDKIHFVEGSNLYCIVDNAPTRCSLHITKGGVEFRVETLKLVSEISPIVSMRKLKDFLLIKYDSTRFLIVKEENEGVCSLLVDKTMEDTSYFDASLDKDSNVWIIFGTKKEESVEIYQLVENDIVLQGVIKVEFPQRRAITGVHFSNQTKSFFYTTKTISPKENKKNSQTNKLWSFQIFQENNQALFAIKKSAIVKKRKKKDSSKKPVTKSVLKKKKQPEKN